MAQIPDKPENEPEDRSFEIFIDIDADFDFETGIFTPKQTVEFSKLSGAVISFGDIVPPSDEGESLYFTKQTYDASIEMTLRPRLEDDEDSQESSDQESEE